MVAHSVPWSLHLYIVTNNVGSQCADYENITCIQRCHNVEFAGALPVVTGQTAQQDGSCRQCSMVGVHNVEYWQVF